MKDRLADTIASAHKGRALGGLLLLTGVILFLVEETFSPLINHCVGHFAAQGMPINERANLEALLNLFATIWEFLSLTCIVLGSVWWIKDLLHGR